MASFEKELEQLINRHSKENISNTPDFLLAQFLIKCLEAYNFIVFERARLANKNLLDKNEI